MATMQEALETLRDNTHRHVVSLSGGKDSTALAIYMRETFPQVPTEYVFCDTGAELPETYEYLDRVESVLGQPIVRLNALDLLRIRKRHSRSPFDVWLNEVYGGYLPNPRARWCTRVLKIQPFELHIGDDRAFSYIGIRADEDREGYSSKKPPALSEQPNIVPVYPFKDAGVGIDDINDILEDSGLGLPKYYQWRSRSGCYFCFYQQIGEWQGLKKHHPSLFDLAKQYETTLNGKRFTWVAGRTLDEIEALNQQFAIRSPLETSGCAICHL